MRIRLEFGRSRSAAFDWVLRLCWKLPSFRQAGNVYTVDFTRGDDNLLEEIFGKVRTWAQTTWYLDGKPTPMLEIQDIILEIKRRRWARTLLNTRKVVEVNCPKCRRQVSYNLEPETAAVIVIQVDQAKPAAGPLISHCPFCGRDIAELVLQKQAIVEADTPADVIRRLKR